MDRKFKKLDIAQAKELRKTAVRLDESSVKALSDDVLDQVSGGEIVDSDVCPFCGGTMYISVADGEIGVICFDCLYVNYFDQP